jgi:hypothetical protein
MVMLGHVPTELLSFPGKGATKCCLEKSTANVSDPHITLQCGSARQVRNGLDYPGNELHDESLLLFKAVF